MNKSENEKKADDLESSFVTQESSSQLTSDETSTREGFLNCEYAVEEETIIREPKCDVTVLIEDQGTNMNVTEDDCDEQFLEILRAGDPGLKSVNDVETFLGTMNNSKDICEKKICLATLIATEDQTIIEKFLNDGGWTKLFEWLDESKLAEDVTFLARLLDLYRLLPVTVQMLKQNSCAKSIKQLIKSPNEVISQHAKAIIDDWMLKVTSNKHKEHKPKKLRNIGKLKSGEIEKCNEVDDTSRSPTTQEKPAPRKRSSSGSSDSLLSDVKITVKILPPRPNQSGSESTSPQGFMNALSSVNSSIPERKRKRIRRPSITKNNNSSSINISNNNGDSLSVSMEDEDDDEKTDIEDNVLQERPLLPQSKERKHKKTVTWANESVLCIYHHFPMDETERVNVNHMADFNEIRRHEIEMEHRMFQNSRRHLHIDVLTDQWRRPPFITGVSYLVEPGCNSTERKTQMMREQNVLQVLYFNKRLLTDQPAEPDPELVEATEPKIIPLSDVTGTNSEILYEHTSNATTSSTSSSSVSSLCSSSSGDLMVTNNNVDVQVSSTSNQGHTSVTPSITWNTVYNVPPPVLTPIMDPQVLQTMMPPIMAPMYPPSLIPPPGFVHPPPHLPPPEFLRGYRPPMHHMTMGIPVPPFVGPSAKPPCAHFLAGNCKFGQNCRFFHPPSTGSPTATTQPSSTKT